MSERRSKLSRARLRSVTQTNFYNNSFLNFRGKTFNCESTSFSFSRNCFHPWSSFLFHHNAFSRYISAVLTESLDPFKDSRLSRETFPAVSRLEDDSKHFWISNIPLLLTAEKYLLHVDELLFSESIQRTNFSFSLWGISSTSDSSLRYHVTLRDSDIAHSYAHWQCFCLADCRSRYIPCDRISNKSLASQTFLRVW